jgi:hypothetical protein
MTTPRTKAVAVAAAELAAVQAANEQTAAAAALAAAKTDADRARAIRRINRVATRVLETAQDLTDYKSGKKNN